jgi:uncharacterized membrane protein
VLADVRLRQRESVLLCLTIAAYVCARFCQVYADRLPILLTVVLHVVPPALFAVVHGRALYRARGIAVFALSCLGVAALSESLSLRTGIPFGSYFFTGVMGPRVFDLPVLLVLAYMGIAYCSWILALLMLGIAEKRFSMRDVLAAPLLASCVFLAWDLAMEADWSTVDRAWIWRQGGAYFGVPMSNFVGWLITAWVFFSIFAVYVKRRHLDQRHASLSFWRYPVVLYGVCAGGNLLILLLPMAPSVVFDATGRAWVTREILLADSAISVLVMGSFAGLAWVRTNRTSR